MKRDTQSTLNFVGKIVLITWILGCGKTPGHPSEIDAVKAIERLGGKVEFDGQGTDRRVTKVYLHKTKVQDADLVSIEKLPKLRSLFIGMTQIGDSGLTHLEKSAELEILALNSTQVTDAGLKSLSGLSNLKTINLQENKVTVAGTNRLRKQRPNLQIAR